MNIAVIPCRKGSKGIPGKNFRDIAGKPLWQWTANAAVESGVFTYIVLSSDGGFDTSFYRGCNIDNRRPEVFSTDAAQLEPLLLYYADIYDADTVTLLQPTSPLRESSDISVAFSLFTEGNYDSVVSVTSVGDKFWIRGADGFFIPMYSPEYRRNRQDPETNVVYYENGAIYITKTSILREKNCRISGNIGFYEMSQINSHQIDSQFDFRVVECMLS